MRRLLGRRGCGRGRAAHGCVADPRALRDVRPAAHDAVRVADVVDGARAARRRQRASRRLWVAAGAALGLSVFVHPTAPLYALTAFAAAASSRRYRPRSRRVARRGRASSRCSSRSCRTTCARCTCSATATASAPAKAAGARSPAGRCGRTRCTSSRRARTTSTTSPCSPLVGRRRAARAQGAPRRSRSACVTVAAPVDLLLGRAGERRLRALLRPLHDPGDAGVPRARRRGLPRDRALGRRAARLLVLAILVAGLLAHRAALRRPPARDSTRSASTRVAHAVAHEPHGTVLFGSTGTSGALLLVVRLRPPREPARPLLVALRVAVAPRRRRRLVCARAAVPAPAPQTPALRRVGLLRRVGRRSRRRRAALARCHGVPVGRCRPRTSSSARARRSPPRALIRLGQSLRLAWRRAVPLNRRVNELLQADRQLLRRPPASAVRRARRPGHLAALAAGRRRRHQ